MKYEKVSKLEFNVPALCEVRSTAEGLHFAKRVLSAGSQTADGSQSAGTLIGMQKRRNVRVSLPINVLRIGLVF